MANQDQISVAKEIESVAAEYFNMDEVWNGLVDHQRYALLEILCSISATPERIIALWEASGLTY